MAVDRVQRRIAAILAADVVGYSRLMGKDEAVTLATLKTYREVIDGLVAHHAGRIFGSAGDSVVAEFASPVDAVRCATEVQLEIGKRNADLPEPNRMRFRIGINLGDVVVDGENLMGDGVNVAARLEALAPPGGVCISEAIHAQVRDRLSLDFLDLGEHKVKNITRPVRAYRVPLASEEQVKSPFRGLDVFDFDHADIFFGRARSVGGCTERLEQQAANGKAFLLIYGMSGSGKSSLLRAGLLPAITRPGAVAGISLWRRCLFRPSEGAEAIASLAAGLLREGALPELAPETTATELADLLRSAPDRAMALIRAALGKAATAAGLVPSQARLALAVDQMEELFTTETAPASREALVRLLATSAASGLVWVIGTIRADFFHRCSEVPGFSSLKDGLSSYELLPPTGPEIAQIIREPARAAGLRFEEATDQGRLEDVLQAAAIADPGSLPLLEFVLDALYEAGRDRRLLTFAAYRALGGLEGAIARRADEVIDALPPDVRDALPAVLRALTTVRLGDDAVTAGPALLADLAGTPTQSALVDALIAARLLVSDEDTEGHAIVRVAHEALLSRWPRARDIVNANRDFLETRARLRTDARRWHSDNRNPDLLLPPGKRLAEGEELLLSRSEEVDDQIVDYIAASSSARQAAAEKERQTERARVEAEAAAATRLARRTRIAAVVALTLAVIAGAGAVVGFNGQHEARREATRAEENANQAEQHASQAKVAEQKALEALNQALFTQSLFLADLSRQQSRRGDYGTAIALALEALPDEAKSVDRPYAAQAEGALYEAASSLREEHVLRGHDNIVSSAVFSPDGTRIVTASDDKTARLWDAANGAEIAVLRGHESSVRSAAFSPDGTRIVTASDDRTARLWDAASGAEVAVLRGHKTTLVSAAFSPDGTRIVTASDDRTARLWDAATGREIAVLRHDDYVRSAVFSSSGTRIATASHDKTARLWDAAGGAEIAVLRGHQSSVRSAAFSPDSTRIVTVSDDKTARLWDATSGTEIGVLRGHENSVWSAAFSPDGARVVTASADRTARLWNAVSGTEIVVLGGHESSVWSAAFSPDGARVVTASADRTARLWNAASGTEIVVLGGHQRPVRSAAFSPDGKRIVTASLDNTPRLWDATGGPKVRLLNGHQRPVRSAAFSPDGKRVVTASDDTTARVWDAASGAEITALHGHVRSVRTAAFSPDGTRIVTASDDRTARLWDAASGAEVAVLLGHETTLVSAVFSPDGTRIVTASADGTARLWDAATGVEIAVLRGHERSVLSAVFSPDSMRVVTASDDGMAWLWDAASGAEISVLRGHESSVLSAVFSPDGKRIVTASRDGTARLWNAANGTEIGVLRGHESSVWSAAFSPDGARVVTASADRTARVWDAASGAEIAVLRGHMNYLYSAAFSPDGARIVTASLDNTARLWDAANGTEIVVLGGHESSVGSAAFSTDGTRIVTVSDDNTARIWPVFPTTQALVDYARSVMPRELTGDQRMKFFLK